MCRVLRMTVSLTVLAIVLGVISPALAVFPPPADDKAKFFGKEALDSANKKIRAIYQNYKKDVVIVTIPALSPEQTKKLDEDGKTKFFAKLARDNAVDIGLNGIYILICKKPQHLQVHMDPDTQKKAFTAANRKTLIDKFVAQFKEDNFDAGLKDALEAIETALKANHK